MTSARNFSRDTQRQAYARAAGCCEVCSARLAPGNTFYDHRIPWETGRNSSLANCQCLCKTCNDFKTYIIDIPNIAHARRLAERHAGIKPLVSRPMPAGRNTGFKRTMRGETIGRMNMGQMLRQMGLVPITDAKPSEHR